MSTLLFLLALFLDIYLTRLRLYGILHSREGDFRTVTVLKKWMIKIEGNMRCGITDDLRVDGLLRDIKVESSGLEEECTLVRLQACLESLQSMTQSSDLALAATRQELMAVCATLKESVVCVDQHMRSCFTTTQRKVFNHVVSGARQFLKELCVPGKTQDAYLKHSPCYRNVSLSEEKCAPEYRLLIQLSEHVDERRDVDEGLKQSCCAFHAFVECKHVHARRDCGLEASDFLQRHLDRISNPLIHEHCEHYMHAQNACAVSGSYDGLHRPLTLFCKAFFSNFAVCVLCLGRKKF